MLVCREHLDRELRICGGAWALLDRSVAVICEVQACTAPARYRWTPDVNQDEIPTYNDITGRKSD